MHIYSVEESDDEYEVPNIQKYIDNGADVNWTNQVHVHIYAYAYVYAYSYVRTLVRNAILHALPSRHI